METGNTELLFETDGILTFNYYDNRLYIGVSKSEKDNGIYCIDLINNQEKTKLSSSSGTEIYILDDEWIYFVDEFERVYRTSDDGKIVEKLFG